LGDDAYCIVPYKPGYSLSPGIAFAILSFLALPAKCAIIVTAVKT